MADSDELEEIREEKLASLRERIGGESEGPSARTGSADSPAEPVAVTGPDHFQEVLDTHSLVLVDFYADWCGPCKMLEPTVETLAADTSATVAKVDVDENQQLAQRYGVRGVPTLVLVADGDVAERITGVRDEAELRGLIDQYA